MKTIICTARKPLIHADGSESFTPGEEYQVNPHVTYLSVDVTTTNNQGQPHMLGPWRKYFKFKN